MSPIRMYEYDWLIKKKVYLYYSCLDVGGGQKSSYAQYLPRNTESVNIPKSGMNPTYTVCSYTWKLPKQYACVVCLNVLEHTFEYKAMIDNIYNALQPNGTAFIAVPFMYRYHPSPDDCWRYSETTLRKLLKQFKEVDIKPIGTGLFMNTFSNEYGITPRLLRPLSYFLAKIFDESLCKLSKRYAKNCGPSSFPIGYLVEARK